MKLSVKEWVVHGVIVVAVLSVLNYPDFDLTFGVFSSGNGTLLIPSLYGTAINLILFYGVALYLIPEVLRKQGALRFSLALVLSFIALSTIEAALDASILRGTGREPMAADWNEIFLLVVLVHVLMLILAFAYRFSKDWFVNEALRKNISEWQARTELEVLKSQINPHFLFNALNNLFSLALKSGDETTAEGISKLSSMMRYVLERSNKDLVSVEAEIQYIEDYIFMQQLRFGKHTKTDFQYTEGCTHKIVPMLLLPFIENAFKYGVSSQRDTQIVIHVSCAVDQVRFSCENEIVEGGESVPSHGIGIENVRKRLALTYPEKHQLQIEAKEGKFMVNLTLDL